MAFSLSEVMIVVKSHFTSRCRVCKSATAEARPRTSAQRWAEPVWMQDPSPDDRERGGGENENSRGTAEGDGSRTASASLVANGLLIAQPMHLAFLHGSRLHPWG